MTRPPAAKAGRWCPLPGRAVVAVAGEDRVSFLQGLVSNDVRLVEDGGAVWSALLTPQGRWLADFFISEEAGVIRLDCEREQAAMVAARLGRFRLRAKIALEITGLHVAVGWDGAADGLADPRLPAAGRRLISAEPIDGNADFAAWDAHRIRLGLPDGSRDLVAERTLLLEAGFDELHGVSWTKGCYMGQELTARTRYRGLVKRRLLPVEAEEAIAPGEVMAGDVAGEVRTVAGNWGLAMLRLDRVAEPLTVHGVRVAVRTPDWVKAGSSFS